MTTARTRFVDGGLARIIALFIALLLAAILWMNYSSDIKMLFSGDTASKGNVVSTSEPAKPVNAALEECLTQRVGDVDRMKEEGILSDAQYGAFKSRAEGLCRAQNPGG